MNNTTSAAFQTNEAVKPLPFDAARLNGLSERLIRSHWENNYGGSVKAPGKGKAADLARAVRHALDAQRAAA